MRHVWVGIGLLAIFLWVATSACASELNGEYQITVTATPTEGVANSYTFEYHVKNINQGTEWLDPPWVMPEGYRTGLDGFFIQVPSSAVIKEVVSPERHYADVWGWWGYELAPPQPTNGRLLKWWGYDLGSMYPIGEEAVFSFRADGVALGSTPAVMFTFGDATGGEAGGYYYADFGTTVTGPVEIPPIADAGSDHCVLATGLLTEVNLDGSRSSDPQGDTLAYEWSIPATSGATLDNPSSATPTGHFPLGPTTVTLTVTDGKGGMDVDDVTVTIIDTIPPVLIATTDKLALWPPNHEIQNVRIGVAITDACWDINVALTAFVASSEPDDATGDGSFVGDVNGHNGFAAPVPVTLIYTGEPVPGVYTYEGVVGLRAERDGSQKSRVYSIISDVSDLGGNTNTASCVVVVPHDKKK